MAKTYADIQKQIQALARKAEQLRQKEVADVVARIKEAISAYGITASDLGLTGSRRANGATRAKPGPKPASKRKAATKAKFRDDAGNTWVGRGPRPQWLRDALASGKKLEDFAA
jgi:DNA-binding protein H-NS